MRTYVRWTVTVGVLLRVVVMLALSACQVRCLALYTDGGQPYLPLETSHDSRPNKLPKETQLLKRKKREAIFVWPMDSLFVAEFYFEIPIRAPTGLAIPFKIDVPYEFTLPNITVEGAAYGQNKERADDRLGVYGIMEGLFNKFGMDGKACLLRAVCEASQSRLLGAGMLGEVILTILTWVDQTGICGWSERRKHAVLSPVKRKNV